jgi:hypothetical protein
LAVVLLGGASVPYVWLRLPSAVVSLDGKPTALPVYRSFDGHLLVWTRGPGDETYVIDPARGDVAPVSYQSLLDDQTEVNHFLVSACFALVMDDYYHPLPVLNYYEGDRHAIVHPGYVEFKPDSLSPRVRVKL